jgi:hypothetical protein
MLAFFSTLLGFALIAAGLVAAVVDGTRSIAAAQLTVSPLGQTWFSLHRGSLTGFQAMVRQSIEPTVGTWVWDPVIQSVLSMPTWLVLAALGAIFVWLAQPRRRRHRRLATR